MITTRQTTIAVLLLLAGLLIIVLLGRIVAFDAGSLQVADTYNASQVQITLNPGGVMTPGNPVELTWKITDITALYLNEGGQIGENTLSVVGDACSTWVFDVHFPDDTARQYTLQPSILLLDPLLWISGLGIVLLLYGASRLIRSHPLMPDLRVAEERWSLLTPLMVFSGVVVLAFYAFVPVCGEVTIPTLASFYPVDVLIYSACALLCALLSLLAILSPSHFSSWTRQVLETTPQPVLVVMVILFIWRMLSLAVLLQAGPSPLPIFTLPLFVWVGLTGIGVLVVNITSTRRIDLNPYILAWNERLNANVGKITLILLLLLAYGALWKLDWQALIPDLWLRSAIALSTVVLSGMIVHRAILPTRRINLLTNLTVGFVISAALIQFTGVMAIGAGSNIQIVMNVLFGFGAISLLIFVWRGGQLRLPSYNLTLKRRHIPLLCAGIIALMVMTRMPYALRYYTNYGGDINTYHAYTTYFADATSYQQTNIVLNTDTAPAVRLQAVFWPFVLAVVVQLSQSHILLLQGILSIYLCMLSFISLYALARRFGFSHAYALLAVLVQMLSMLLLMGSPEINVRLLGFSFFWRILEDKYVAVFILFPIMLRVVLDYLEYRDWRHFLLLLIASSGFALSHVTVPAMAALAIGLFCLQSLFFDRRLKPIVLTLLAVAIPLLFPFALSNAEKNLFTTLDEAVTVRPVLGNIYTIEGTSFYGLKSSLISNLPYALVSIAAIAALARLKKSKSARLILALALIMLLAIFPYTGWILGRLLTVFQLDRVLWLMPFGLSAAFLVQTTAGVVGSITPQRMRSVIPPGAAVFVACWIIVLLPDWAELTRDLETQRRVETSIIKARLSTYASLKPVIESTFPAEMVTVLAEHEFMSIIPSISASARPIFFRDASLTANQSGISLAQAKIREADVNLFFSADASSAQRLDLLDSYAVDLVIVRTDNAGMRTFFEQESTYFEPIAQIDHLMLYRFVLSGES